MIDVKVHKAVSARQVAYPGLLRFITHVDNCRLETTNKVLSTPGQVPGDNCKMMIEQAVLVKRTFINSLLSS